MNYTTVQVGHENMVKGSSNFKKKAPEIESYSGPTLNLLSHRRNYPYAYSQTRSLCKENKISKETSSSAYQQWFNDLNAHPNATIFSSAEFDPPHFLQSNQSSAQSDQVYADGNDSSEALIRNYRSIIDDLTIENRNLKEKLRWQQNQPINQLDKDKLFELRIHELPPGKRRELEKTLRSFVYSFSEAGDERLEPKLSFSHVKHTVEATADSVPNQSSSTSTYHSPLQDFSHVSANTSKHPTTIDLDSKSPEETRTTPQDADKLIIPQQDLIAQYPQYAEGHLSNHTSKYMSKMQTMKLVVQRLEQLYTGKSSLNLKEHHKSSVTPENSNLAQCGLQSSDKSKSRLGAREAHMKKLSSRSEDSTSPDNFSRPEECSGIPSHSSMSDENSSETSSSDQRPTRPFDLDPDRSQIPAENMQYIRHLGLSPVTIKINDSANHVENNGWVYLNLLTNMAQLHIINVTTEFVRTSVLKMSKNLEISSNGQMIRWKGDNKEAATPSNGSTGSKSGSFCIPDPNIPEKYHVETEMETRNELFLTSSVSRNNFHYVPLFNHENQSTKTTESIVSQSNFYSREWESRTPAPHAHNWRSKKHIVLEEEPPLNDGAIIFYNRARFYVDLCGDREIAGIPFPFSSSEEDTSSSYGKELKLENLPRSESGSFLSSRQFKQLLQQQSSDDEDLSSLLQIPPATEANLSELHFPQHSQKEFCIPSSLQPLKASGIGGTQPADHFEMHVLTRRSTIIPTRLFKKRGCRMKRINRPISRNSLNMFHNPIDGPRGVQTAPDKSSSIENKIDPVQIAIISTETIPLPPSQLPQPPGIVSPPESDLNSETTSSLNIKYRSTEQSISI